MLLLLLLLFLLLFLLWQFGFVFSCFQLMIDGGEEEEEEGRMSWIHVLMREKKNNQFHPLHCLHHHHHNKGSLLIALTDFCCWFLPSIRLNHFSSKFFLSPLRALSVLLPLLAAGHWPLVCVYCPHARMAAACLKFQFFLSEVPIIPVGRAIKRTKQPSATPEEGVQTEDDPKQTQARQFSLLLQFNFCCRCFCCFHCFCSVLLLLH